MNVYKTSFNFLNQLDSLLRGMSLVEALKCLSRLQNQTKEVRAIAVGVLENIEKGYGFSRALTLCSQFEFRKGSLDLLEAAEYSSRIKEILSFICIQHKRDINLKNDIQSMLLYPLVIVLCALVGTFFLVYWKNLFLISMSTTSLLSIIMRALTILLLSLLLVSFYVYTELKMPYVFQLYYSLSVLQGAGFTFQRAVELCLENGLCHSSQENLYTLYHNLKNGMTVTNAFRDARLANETRLIQLEIAEKTSRLAQTFSHFADEILEVHDYKKKRCLQLIEPLLFFCVGLYLVIILEGIFLPYLTDLGGLV